MTRTTAPDGSGVTKRRARASKDAHQLTGKQAAFVREYLVDLNATQAAIRAGYSARRADQQGLENLRKPEIAAAIAAAMRSRQHRTEITQDRVLQELARIAFLDPGKLFDAAGAPVPLQTLDEDTRRAVVGLDVVTVGNADAGIGQVQKVKLADKKGALELLGRHLGMWNDKLDMTVTNELADRLARARKRRG